MAGINLTQLKQYVIVPVLNKLGASCNSPAAVNLLVGTFLVESGGIYLHQLGAGPALGGWQMEPATHDDCYTNYLNFSDNAALHKAVAGLAINFYDPDRAPEMAGNLYYACAMARIKYRRAPAALPNASDALGMADYHKTYYNTAGGATQVALSQPLFAQAIAA